MKIVLLCIFCVVQFTFAESNRITIRGVGAEVAYVSLGKYISRDGHLMLASSIKNTSPFKLKWKLITKDSQLIDVDVSKLSTTEYDKNSYTVSKANGFWTSGQTKSLLFKITDSKDINVRIKLCHNNDCWILSVANLKKGKI